MTLSKKLYVMLVFLTGFILGIGFLVAGRMIFIPAPAYAETNSTNAVNPEDDNYYKYFPMFRETYNTLKREFYDKDEVTAKNLFYGAIKGMMGNMNDSYTIFMEPENAKEFNIEMAGSFGGLGIQIDIRDEWLTIISPIEDTPTWKAGLKPGDKIIEIDGKSTKGITVNEAISKMRGKPGTKITITISRSGIKDAFPVTIKREEIKLKMVKSDVISYKNKKMAYLKIQEFSQQTAEEFKKQLLALADKKPDGLIVDLRNNPGGLLNIVVNCANFFLSDGLIVYTRGRLAENNADYMAFKDQTIIPQNLPMVVMINQGSASASEIFAGAMQDTGRAVLVGMKSYGKGSVQKTLTFPDDGSLIKYTVAKYFTPSGRSIDKVGLNPDIEEKMWYETLSDTEKLDMIKVQETNFIKEYIAKNPKDSEESVKAFQSSLENQGFHISMKSLPWMIKIKRTENDPPAIYDSEFDNQLEKALNVLNNYKDYKKPDKVFKQAK